jgi:hypothetical protein
MSTIGNSTTVVTLTPSERTATITGAITAYGSIGVYKIATAGQPENHVIDAALFAPSGATAFTIVNNGRITSNGTSAYGTGIVLGHAGTITNAGTITAADGIAIFGSATGAAVTNTKLIDSTIGFGIYLQGNGQVQNKGQLFAGTLGIALAAGGKVINTGTIKTASDYGDGILVTGGKADYIHNTGTITAGRFGQATAILLTGPGKVVNAGTIQGDYGIHLIAAGTAVNTGKIFAGEGMGIELSGGGTVIESGYLRAATGIFVAGAAGHVTAAGTINAEGGIFLTDGGFVTTSASIVANDGINLTGGLAKNSGVISASFDGVVTQADVATLDNTGTILANNEGVRLVAGGTIINAGTISATSYGVVITSGGTLIDTGTIEGGSGAIYFESFANSRLILSPTASIIGSAQLNGAALEFAADGATIGTFAPENLQFINAGSITIDTGAIWDLAGTFTNGTAGILLNNGTVKEGPTDLISINGPVQGTGLIELGKKPLTVESTVAASQKLEFTGTGETLLLGDPQDFHAKIESFALGDTISLIDIPKTSITSTHFAAGILTLSEKTGAITITFATPATFGSDIFVLTTAGANTAITLKKPSMSIQSPTTPPDITSFPALTTPASPLAAPALVPPANQGIAYHLLPPTPTTLPPITLQP